MYKIIGADQREYGPVTSDEVRAWVREGRANGATLAKAEGGTEWAPLSSFAEFNDLFGATGALPPPPPGSSAPSNPADLAEYIRAHGYDIDIGSCVSRSWELLKQNFGLMVGSTAIFLIMVVALNQLIGLFTRGAVQTLMTGNVSAGPILVIALATLPEMALSAVLSGGIYSLLLKLIRGQPAGIGDLFSGFGRPFVQLAAAGIVIQVLTMVGILACVIPGIYLSVSWILTIPLIVDRDLDFWAAMEVSRRVVTHKWWLMFCVLVVVALLSLVGFLACCVGVLAGIPLGMGTLIYAYEDIFGRPGPTAS